MPVQSSDSNFCEGRSGHTYTLTRQSNGTTNVDVVIVREGKSLQGKLLGDFPGIIGKGQLKKVFAKNLKTIEARNDEVGKAAPA